MKKVLLSLALLLGALMFPSAADAQDIHGDVNGDFEVSIADVNAIFSIILQGGFTAAADVNNDLEVNIADVNAVINAILNGMNDSQWDVNGDNEVNIADVNAIITIILRM